MKQFFKMLFLVLSCAATLASTSAFAATWSTDIDKIISPSQDIERVVISQVNTDYTLSMYLKGAPSLADLGTIYGIYLTNDRNLLQNMNYSNQFGYYAEAQVSTTPRNALAFTTSTRNSTNYSFTTSGNLLEWRISASQVDDNPFYFAGATFGSNLQLIDKTSIAATPIPGTAWLLVSGILGLVGLKRRKQLKLT